MKQLKLLANYLPREQWRKFLIEFQKANYTLKSGKNKKPLKKIESKKKPLKKVDSDESSIESEKSKYWWFINYNKNKWIFLNICWIFIYEKINY